MPSRALFTSLTVPVMLDDKISQPVDTVTFTLTYNGGILRLTNTAVLNTAVINNAAALLRGTHAERVPGQPLFLADLNCHCFDPATTQVLNPKAWTDPVAGTFASSSIFYDDYRYQRRPRETLSFGRIFSIHENVKFQLRAEFTNPFNRTQVPNPVIGSPTAAGSGSYATGITSQVGFNGNRVNSSGFGAIATQPASAVIGERSGLLVGRLTF